MRRAYRFASPWQVAEFFIALGIFTRCDYGTAWNDSRLALVDCPTEQDQIHCDSFAKQSGGRLEDVDFSKKS